MTLSLGDRMKAHERAWRATMPPRTPLIIRLDGRAFHTLTKGCDKPFDRKVIAAMDWAATEVCRDVQGAELGYVQSDEISVLVHPYKTFASQAWFGGRVQKMVSIAASICSVAFSEMYGRKAAFDARAFALPEDEVCNYFVWRQQDWIRNSVQMLGRSLFSHKELLNKSAEQVRWMCRDAGHSWELLEPHDRLGRCVIRDGGGRWHVDPNAPVFRLERDYVDGHLVTKEQLELRAAAEAAE